VCLGNVVIRIIALNRFRISQNVYYPLRYEAEFNSELQKLMRTKQRTHDIIADKEEKRKSKKNKKKLDKA